MKNLPYLFISIVLACLINQVYSTIPNKCMAQPGCLDAKGACLNIHCKEICVTNSDCSLDCCIGGICDLSGECDKDKAIQIITIVFSVFAGTIILLTTICCIIQRRRLAQQKKGNAKFKAQQAAINNHGLKNNQQNMNKIMEMQQMQLQYQQLDFQQQQFGMQQQQFGMQQQPFQMQQQPFGMQQQPFGMQQQPFGIQQQPFVMQADLYNPQQQQGLIVTNTQNQKQNQNGLVSYL